jgi:hypothetical protein
MRTNFLKGSSASKFTSEVLKAGNKRERVGVRDRVAGDGGLRVTLDPAFHVACLRGPVFVDSSAIAPLRVEADSIRRISDHEPRFALAQKKRNVLRACRVAAKDAVLTAEPHVAWPRRRNIRQRWRLVRSLLIHRIAQQHVPPGPLKLLFSRAAKPSSPKVFPNMTVGSTLGDVIRQSRNDASGISGHTQKEWRYAANLLKGALCSASFMAAEKESLQAVPFVLRSDFAADPRGRNFCDFVL